MVHSFFILVNRADPAKPLYWAGSIVRFVEDKKLVRGYARRLSAEGGRKQLLRKHPELNPELLVVEQLP